MVDPSPYIAGFRARAAAGRAADAVASVAARAGAERAASCLAAEFGASRVVLVGSLARGQFTTASDIDLVVLGISPERFYAAGAAAEAAAGVAAVDIIPMEGINTLLLDEMVRDGVVLVGAG